VAPVIIHRLLYNNGVF